MYMYICSFVITAILVMLLRYVTTLCQLDDIHHLGRKDCMFKEDVGIFMYMHHIRIEAAPRIVAAPRAHRNNRSCHTHT